MSDHAMLSPSGFKALMLCPGKPAMERGLPDNDNEYSAEGTAAAELGALCLKQGVVNTPAFLGRVYQVSGFNIEATQDFCDNVQFYVDAVRARVDEYLTAGATLVELFVEQKAPIGHITGEAGAEGTFDTLIIPTFADGTSILDVWDLKFGRGVEVSAVDNPQLRMYAAGVLSARGLAYEFKRVRMTIHQPRVRREPVEEEISVDELEAWVERVAKPAARHSLYLLNLPVAALTSVGKAHALEDLDVLNPGEEQCRFCKAKLTCPALQGHIFQTVAGDFPDLSDPTGTQTWLKNAVAEVKHEDAAQLAELFPHLDLIHDWVKAVRARIEVIVFEGGTVPGLKLVKGKRGNRTWSSAAAAEALFKSMRLKKEEMYDMTLISPTTAEKLLKDTPKRWDRAAALIVQAEGKPTVVPESDSRPPIQIHATADEFVDVAGAEELV